VETGLQGYSGRGYSPLGEKGRYVLPPAFRKAVIASSDGRILCIDKHPRLTCLVGFGLSRQDELLAQLDREEAVAWQHGRDFDRDSREAQLFGYLQIPFDDSGRFVLPDPLPGLANATGGLYFHGAGRSFTIWNPDELARMGGEWESAKASCNTLVAEAEVKAKKK